MSKTNIEIMTENFLRKFRALLKEYNAEICWDEEDQQIEIYLDDYAPIPYDPVVISPSSSIAEYTAWTFNEKQKDASSN